jgi:hypothetical protein
MITIKLKAPINNPVTNKQIFDWIQDDPSSPPVKQYAFVGESLANTLLYSTNQNKARCYQLAMELMKAKDTIDLKAEDVLFLKGIVAESKNLPIISGYLLSLLEEEK